MLILAGCGTSTTAILAVTNKDHLATSDRANRGIPVLTRLSASDRNTVPVFLFSKGVRPNAVGRQMNGSPSVSEAGLRET